MAAAAAAGASAGPKFQFSIVALDQYTKTFRDLNKKATAAFRPFQRVGNKLAALGKEMHLDKAAAGMQKIAAAGASLAESLGIASPALRAVGALGFAGGLAAAAAGAGLLAYRVGSMGLNVTRASQRLNMSTTTLQRFRGAADLANVSADSMQQSLQSLGQTMEDAMSNRNPAAATLFNAFTGGIAKGANGAPDAGEQMLRMLQAAKGMKNPYARGKFFEEAGLSTDLLPLANGGRAGFTGLMDEAQRRGSVLTGEAAANALKFNAELAKLRVSFDGLANTVGSKLLPSVTGLVTFLDGLTQHFWATMFFQKPVSGFGPGAPSAAGSAGSPVGAPSGSTLGLSLNNPGNLRKWGSRPVVGGFAQFPTAQAGLDAMANQLVGYQDVHGLNTIDGILSRWAPSKDGNNLPAYSADVSKRTGFGHAQALDLHDPSQLATLMGGMIQHEQGSQPFSSTQLQSAAQHVVVTIVGKMPAGVDVNATVNGAWVPTRIDRSMATNLPIE